MNLRCHVLTRFAPKLQAFSTHLWMTRYLDYHLINERLNQIKNAAAQHGGRGQKFVCYPLLPDVILQDRQDIPSL